MLTRIMPDEQLAVTLGTGWTYAPLPWDPDHPEMELVLIVEEDEVVDLSIPEHGNAPWMWEEDHWAAEAGMFCAVEHL